MGECRKCQFFSVDLLVQMSRSLEDGQNSKDGQNFEDGQNSGQLYYQQTLWHRACCRPHTGHTYRQLYKHLKFARLPVLSWLASRNCSLAKLCAHLYVILFVLMGSPASAAPLSTETWVGAPWVDAACSVQFVHRLRSCVQPFLSSLDEQQMTTSLTLGKHLCLKYQLVLLCVHSVLTECPGVDNIRQVQTTLGSHRVVHVNHLCSIASQNHKHLAVGDQTTLRHHQHRSDVVRNVTSNQLPGALMQSLMNTSDSHGNDLHTTVTHPGSPSLATSARLVLTTQGPSGDQRTDSVSHDMPLSIHDFVNNYQFHKSPVVDTGGSSNSLFQIMVATSTADATQLHLSLLFVVSVGLILTIY